MDGFRNGTITWRAVLSRSIDYASDRTASRKRGNSTRQIDPKDLLQFLIIVDDPTIPMNDPRHRLHVEPGIDSSFIESVKPYCVVLRGPLQYDSMNLVARHTVDMKPGASAHEIAVLEFRRGEETLYLVHAPGETIVQKRAPV